MASYSDYYGRVELDSVQDALGTPFFEAARYYNFKHGDWADRDGQEPTCRRIIDVINQTRFTPLEVARALYQAGIKEKSTIKKNQAVLIIRCHYRMTKTGEDCGVGDMIAALEAMGLSDNANGSMDARVDDIMFPDGAAMDTYGGGAIQQSGGSPHDLATLLFLKRNLIDKLVEVGPEYAGRLVGWIDGQLAKLATLKGCVQDILGINPATFYDDITGALGGLYNRSALVVGDTTSAVSVWINKNKAMAFGLTAFVLRYQNNIVGAGRAVGSVLPIIFNELATAGSNFQTVIKHFWQSDIGVALLLSLYYYDQNADLVNAAAVESAAAIKAGGENVMAAIKLFESHVNGITDQYAKVKLNDDLIKMMATVKKSIDASAPDDAAHRVELATILDKTAQIQINIVNTVAATARTRSQTARIAAARNTLTTVQDQLTEETRALIAAVLAAKGARNGGKSRSRKSHKKVSKSKRPKRSVHSRKAKGVKRSNKKH
jgi:hypothetical protein